MKNMLPPLDILDNESKQVAELPPEPCSTQNPDEELAVFSWIGEIEKVLMEDDNFDHRVATQPVLVDDFLLRNRYAVVRSRERKKMYVKDLQMKSRYLEGECRGLNHVLQCFIDENQALQIFVSSSL
ncbi:hypothetical protein Golob_021460 [Gossypium lobatum]|uniref:BZIP domain-containing protein n=1 Tax=Gossypium lobatum TaxID=34289 RepID=A0A7J8LDK3_9ROSI|nr:hypothetical protein [Gossypium lobatum]